MSIIISLSIIFALAAIAFRIATSSNVYEKITGFYFVFTNFIILILLNAVTNFDAMLDIIIILFLLQFVAILFLLFNRKKT
ncbi:MAG: hypothetical protein EXR06_04160 [Rickettsiales bacterium]|nr:hypothetical protein [Rickettsiales bacterium]